MRYIERYQQTGGRRLMAFAARWLVDGSIPARCRRAWAGRASAPRNRCAHHAPAHPPRARLLPAWRLAALLLAALAALCANPAQAQTDLPWSTTMTVGEGTEHTVGSVTAGPRGFNSDGFNNPYGGLADEDFVYGSTAREITRLVGNSFTAGDGVSLVFSASMTDAERDALTLEFGGETLPLADATFNSATNRVIRWDAAWLAANASSLTVDNYRTTLADGGTVNVCLRTSAQVCPGVTPPASDLPWSATMTVGEETDTSVDDDELARGYVGFGSDMYGSLADDDFTHSGVDYTIRYLTVTTGAVEFTLIPATPLADESDLVLEIAGEELDLSDGDNFFGGATRQHFWYTEDLPTTHGFYYDGTSTYQDTLAEGTTVNVCLRTSTQTCGGTTPTLSDDATLSALTVNDGTSDLTLAPVFASGTYAYAATAGNAVTTVTLTATPNHTGGSVTGVTLGGTAIADTDFTDGITVPSLVEGDNVIVVTVTAEDASTQDYTVTVTRSRRTTTTPAAPPEIEVPNDWSLIPSGLGAGDKFRLIFLSSTKTNATSYDIADYNTFIQGRAAAGHSDIQTYSSGFRAVGCTPDSDARDNAAITGTGVRIHWLNGNKVADNYGDFKDGTWDDEANDKEEDGTNGPDTSVTANLPFTGCADNGTEDFGGAFSFALGTPDGDVRVGRPNSSSSGDGPLTSNTSHAGTNTRPMYGLSQVFEVAAAAAAPTVTISADKTSAVFKEEGITYTLTRSGATTDALAVSVTLTQDKDFLLTADLTETVTIAAGQSTGTFTVAASSFQDFATGTTVEAGTLTAAVQDGTDYDLGATSTVDVAIVIGVMVSLEVTSLSATEDAGTFSFKVIGRTGAGAPQPSSSTGTIRVLLQSGTAIKGTDFAFQDVLDAEFLATDFSADGATWKAERTFTVSIENDSLDEDEESFNLTVERHFTTSGVYSLVRNGNSCGSVCQVTVTITDDDTAGVTISETALTVEEQDTTGETYTVVLDSEPTASVVVAVTGTTTEVSATPASLTFTTANWDTAQEVTVKAANDTNTADETVNLTHAATSTDSDYSGITIDGVTVTVNDNDTAKVTGVTLVPSSQQVVVAWTRVSNATGYQVQWKSGGQSYNNTRQSVVSGGNTTAVTVSSLTIDTEYTFRVRATRTGANDGPYSDEEMVTTRREGVTFSKSMLTVTEEDTTGDSYTIVLDTQPTGDVTITISGHAGTEVTPNPASLTFTTSNWETAQTVTVTAGNDGDTADDMVTLSHSGSSTDMAYDAEAAGVSVTVLDNDDTAQVTGLTLTPGNGRLVANWTAVTDATGYQVQWKSGVQSYNNSGRQATINSGSTVSHTIPSLTNGTTYTVRVRATQTGADAGAYSDEAMDAPVAGGSTDATLSALALKVAEDGSTIDLNESFSSATKSYTADVADDVLEITVEPTSDHNATFAYLDASDTALTDTDANNAGFQTMLLEGANTIKVKVTAEDGNTTDTYTVVVTRAMTTITPPSGNVLVSNLGQTDGGVGSFASFDQAQAFTTGDNFGGYALTSVDIQTSSTPNLDRLTVSIHADSSGSPDANVGTLTNPDSVGGDGIATYTASGAGIDLVKETTYFIVVDASGSATGSMQNTGSDAEDAGAAANWSIADGSLYRAKDATGAWTAFGDTKKIRIIGTVTPGMASTDADLTGLALKDASDDSTIDLNESFATATMSYTADVGNDVAAATVEPALSDSNATVAYLDASNTALTDADANKTGFQTALFVGETTIKVKVTAEDEATTETYTVVVTRTAATATTEVTIAADAATAIYNEIGASFTVTRTGATTGTLDVVVALTQSKQFLDAGELSRTVRIAAGSASGTLSISSGDLLLPDTEVRESGTLTATVLAGTGYNPGTTATASVDVVVALTVSFDERSYSVNEGVGTLQVMLVGRTGVGAPVPGSTSFSVSTARLSSPEAISPEDYSSLSVVVEIPGSAYVADGNVYRAEIPVEVVIVDDLRDEPDEDFHLELDKSPGQAPRHSNLTDADGVGCRNPVCGTPITIEDNDATPTVTLVLTPDSITENGGISRVTATLDHPSSETTTINISMTPVSPAVAGDYNLSTTQRLTIEPGDTEDSGTGKVSLQAVNNNVYFGDKSVTISGTASNDLAIVQPQAKTLTIEDDESGTDTDATLSGLALKIAADDSAVALTPVFASATTSYTATVGIGMDELTVEATENDSNATVAYLDGSDTALTDTDAHKAGFQTAVAEGANTIKVKVTAEDRSTTGTYTVVVTRATAATDADLTGLALKIAADDSTVALSPGFTTAGTSYTAMVANPVLSITVEPTLSDSNAAVAYLNFADVERVDADPVKAGFQVALIGGQNTINVRVTAEDDQTTKTYTVVVMRAFNTSAVGKPAIEGTAQLGQTLTALIGSIADVDGLPVTFPDDYDFQWARVDADGSSNKTDIFTATTHTYMPVAEDVGKKVKVQVSFTDAGDNVEARPSDAYPSTGTIIAGTLPALSFVSSDIIVDEDDGTATITVERDPASTGTVTVDYATIENSAKAGEDFTATSGTLTFTAGQTSKTVTVPITDDDAYENRETFFVELSNPTGATLPDPPSARIRIDSEDAVPTATMADVTVDEGAGTMTLILRLSHPSQYDIAYLARATGVTGTATEGDDYDDFLLDSGNTADITVPGGSLSQTFDITIVDDGVEEPDETIVIEWQKGSADDVTPEYIDFTGTITDNDTAGVTVSKTALTVTEQDTTGDSYTVVLDSQPTANVTVTVAGHAGTDVTPTPTTLTFTSTTWNTPQPVRVTAADDADTVNDSVSLSHSAASSDANYSGITIAGVAVTVSDNDGSNTAPVFTGGTTQTRTLAETVGDATAGTAAGIGVAVSATDANNDTLTYALGGTDAGKFSFVTSSGQIRTKAGESYDYEVKTSYAVTVTVDDGTVSVPAAVTIRITNNTNERPLAPAAPTLTPTPGSTSSLEVTWTAPLNTGRPAITVYDLQYRVDGVNSWTDGPQDVSGTDASITGLTTGTTYEVQVRALNTDGAGAWSGAAEGRTAAPTPTVRFGASVYTSIEGLPGAVVTVLLEPAASSAVTVPLTETPQDGATIEDYSGVLESVTFAAGETAKTFTVTALEDTVNDDGESLQLGFGDLPSGVLLGSPSTARVALVADSGVSTWFLFFAESTYTATEGGAAARVTVGLSSPWKPKLNKPLTVGIFAPEHRGGADASDYSGVPARVTFQPGQTRASFTVTATDDSFDDDGESIYLEFTGPDMEDLELGRGPRAATVHLRDDDGAIAVKAFFGEQTYRANEGSTVTVSVQLDRAPGRALSIPITTAHGNGAISADYSGVPASITFSSSQSTQTFNVQVRTDNVNDDHEYVTFGFGELPASVSAGEPATATLNLVDTGDALSGRTVYFDAQESNVRELLEGSTYSLYVYLDKEADNDIVVPLQVDNLDGATTADYSGVPETVIIRKGARRENVIIRVLEDTEDDHGEGIRVSFGSLPRGVSKNHRADTATFRFLDNDTVPAISIAGAYVKEWPNPQSYLRFVASLDYAAEFEVTVDYRTVNGSAVAGQDYESESGTLTFAEGERSKHIRVLVCHDGIDESTETMTLQLSNPVRGKLQGGGSATGTIGNNNGSGAKPCSTGISVSDVSALEPNINHLQRQEIEFGVSLNQADSGTVSVNYRTHDGTATAGLDYESASGTLTFRPGQTRKTVTVVVVADAIDDPGETFTLRLSNASGAYIGDGEGTATLTNSGPMPGAWLSRFGRVASDHVIEAVGERWQGGPQAQHLRIGGRQAGDLFGWAGLGGRSGLGGRDPAVDRDDPAGAGADISATAPGMSLLDMNTAPGMSLLDMNTAPDGAGGVEREAGKTQSGRAAQGALLRALGLPDPRAAPDLRTLLMGSSFFYSAALDEDGESRSPGRTRLPGWLGEWSAWGRTASSRFSGADDKLTLDGEVATAMLGFDSRWDRWLAGVVVSFSEGQGAYTHPTVSGGAVVSTMTGLNPYARFELNERTSVWGVLGYGAGDLSLTPAGSEKALETDLTNAMAAFGGRTALSVRTGEAGRFELALRSDARLTNTASEAIEGLFGAEGRTARVRLMLEGSGSMRLATGGVLKPKLEAGLRYDTGDAETGTGLEVGGGLGYAAGRLSVEVNARGLVAHRDTEYEEWGFSGLIAYTPSEDGRGLSMRLGSAWGATQSGVQSLWSRQDASGLVSNAAFEAAQRYQVELRYGLDGKTGRARWEPFVGVESAAGSSRALRLGVKLTSGRRLDAALELGWRQGRPGTDPEQAVQLRGVLRWRELKSRTAAGK